MNFDNLVHQPTRLRLFTHLYVNGEADFSELKSTLGTTDGNLASHIEKMNEADCLIVEKQFVDDTPQTTYRLTERGEELFESHIETLEELIATLDT